MLLGELLTQAHRPLSISAVFSCLHRTLTNLLFLEGFLHLLEVRQESYVGTNLGGKG